jgi:hypothetical protein
MAARRYQTGATTQVRATGGTLRVHEVVEERVDGGAGAANVCSEGAAVQKVVDDRRPACRLGEIVGRKGREVARTTHRGESLR